MRSDFARIYIAPAIKITLEYAGLLALILIVILIGIIIMERRNK